MKGVKGVQEAKRLRGLTRGSQSGRRWGEKERNNGQELEADPTVILTNEWTNRGNISDP